MGPYEEMQTLKFLDEFSRTMKGEQQQMCFTDEEHSNNNNNNNTMVHSSLYHKHLKEFYDSPLSSYQFRDLLEQFGYEFIKDNPFLGSATAFDDALKLYQVTIVFIDYLFTR